MSQITRKPRVKKTVTAEVPAVPEVPEVPAVPEVPNASPVPPAAQQRPVVVGATKTGTLEIRGQSGAGPWPVVVVGAEDSWKIRSPWYGELARHHNAAALYRKLLAETGATKLVFDIRDRAANDLATRIRRERALIEIQEQYGARGEHLTVVFLNPHTRDTAIRRGVQLTDPLPEDLITN